MQAVQRFQAGARPFAPVPRSPGRARQIKGPLARCLAGGLAFAIACGASRLAWALDGPGQTASAAGTVVWSAPAHHPREKTLLKRQWGVEVMFVRQTAAGYMLEFRYRVLDAEKAKPLFERRAKPVLTHAESGARLTVPTPPTTGALRNSNPPVSGQVYWMFFANPGRLVKPGQHVSIEIGAFRVEGLVVE